MLSNRSILLPAVATQCFGTGISAMSVLVFATGIAGSTGAAIVVGAGLAGIVMGGPLVGFLARALAPHKALLVGELVRFCCVAALLLFDLGMAGVAALAMCMAVSDSVSISNRWQILFSSAGVNDAEIYQIQQTEVVFGILSPLAGGYAITGLGLKYGYFFGGLFLLLALSCWTIYCRDLSLKAVQKSGTWTGYLTIARSRPLLGLILLRIFTGSSLVIWTIFLPSALHDLYGDSFASSQGQLAAISALAVALSGYIVSKYVAPGKETSRAIAVSAGAMVAFGISMSVFAGVVNSYLILCLAAVAFGLYVPSIRASIVQIGKRVTPADQVSAVISSGDSLVRTANLLLALAFGAVLAAIESGSQRGTLFLVMTGVSAASVLALRLIPLSQRTRL